MKNDSNDKLREIAGETKTLSEPDGFITLNKVEKMLLALLRSSLHQEEVDTSYFHDVTLEEWRLCRRLAAHHGVMALAWEGVCLLPPAQRPPKRIMVNWGLAVETYERKYRRYCQTIDELSKFYASHGIRTLQLKGVGYSSLYSVPSHREGGDIDIYTYATEGSGMTDAQANALADSLMKEKGIKVDDSHNVKHSSFTYQGITVENHKTFLNVERYNVAPQVEKMLKRCMNPQVTPLLEGEVLTPSVAFNTLFISFHALGHFPGMLNLHHLYDWAILIKQYGIQLPDDLKDPLLLQGIAAITHLCNRFLGTDVQMDGGEKVAAIIWKDMFRPKYPNDVPVSNKIGILVFKTKRMIYTHHLKSSIIYFPLWKRIWTSIVSHIKEPQTIFKRKHH